MRGERPFSEFTFAFAATHEIASSTPWWTNRAPIIPSLRAEGRLGYDVKFELPGSFLFIQFKLGRYVQKLRLVGDELQYSVSTPRLRGLARHGLWQFWTEQSQHRLLERLSARFPAAYYVAPRFNTEADLHTLYGDQQIMNSCIVARLGQFPGARSDNGHRHRVISPTMNPAELFICSRVTQANNVRWQKEMVDLARSWPNEKPLGYQVLDLWERIPGSARMNTRALSQATRLIGARPSVTFDDRLAQRALIPTDTAGLAPRAARRVRTPPWTLPIIPQPIDDDLGATVQLQAKLTVIAERLSAFGIMTVIAQPSVRALL